MAAKTMTVLLMQSVKHRGTLHFPGVELELEVKLAKQLVADGAACKPPVPEAPEEAPEDVSDQGGQGGDQ
ncbi:hypothetical protein [Nitratidesulfovibrio vulgaris]|uniref:Uncharacterized protein n=1 Tax=Nitratidesulfovibrio vulgaris (strain ATCC 29579 / DSM 644 / CCUG 34227 / NCIMB 8303 / VKM B-1760 / Hildenborough) TaxID=882 RepID=Q72A30_NITV2|nr:hypothetical protein [Nitratidesulfovibrio vulgaris]AAS96640.1 hypothetical protein DVU_2167 [Nitratidesulfovibrio vulgaris str. Hildenborough]ADP87166.1 hypothetical protein Deval_2019 [Nitratidesulfovibrio vulgaris RCH1]